MVSELLTHTYRKPRRWSGEEKKKKTHSITNTPEPNRSVKRHFSPILWIQQIAHPKFSNNTSFLLRLDPKRRETFPLTIVGWIGSVFFSYSSITRTCFFFVQVEKKKTEFKEKTFDLAIMRFPGREVKFVSWQMPGIQASLAGLGPDSRQSLNLSWQPAVTLHAAMNFPQKIKSPLRRSPTLTSHTLWHYTNKDRLQNQPKKKGKKTFPSFTTSQLIRGKWKSMRNCTQTKT